MAGCTRFATGVERLWNGDCNVPCFTPGTTIATPYGACAVEDLSVGDRVMTRDNGLQPIRWIGQRQLDRNALQGAAHLQPVLVAEGALGNGMPERDLLLSPNHRVLITNDKTAFYFEDREILVAAKHLTGLSGVDAVETSSIDYIHFVCEGHEVVCADGAWIECFQPADQSQRGLDRAQREEVLMLFPQLQAQPPMPSPTPRPQRDRKGGVQWFIH
ncbi:Hint domain protein [Phaeobacter inhibens]|uniref:Hint domain protein n=1 Tax=Phaeobacter inhibens TaxID=221822 RepID=A0A2I7H9A8_9RHOB|nr:Hint domain protein [Phaeobacter inhibens]AUQ62426.1 Hint domain protein [Phaeobacter inhibens]AUQ82329.1 Hint domain protein [Phaeobacter inhibens]AUQ90090.1 Hint domain protein [Phaeobacter inhibens]AUQ98840.1 Hint domain protein [Phaeobacter inhibens]